MRKYLITLVVLFVCIEQTEAQRMADMVNIPAAPQTVALFKNIAAPVSNYTGQPNISIPIYTISQDGVEVPVSISFNTSGIFVNEEATSVGLGVRLDWGGSIVRSANGRPDERGFFNEAYKIGTLNQELPKDYSVYAPPVPALCYPYCGNSTSLATYKNRVEEYHSVNTYNDPYKDGNIGFATDLRPDDFFYNVLGKSGLFKFNQADRKFLTFPLDDIKIEKTSTTAGIQNFEITKSDGVKIILGDGAVESTKELFAPFDQSWFVKKITTIKNSTIDFSYIDNSYSRINDDRFEIRTPYPSGGYTSRIAGQPYTTTEKLIKSINFKGGKLDFIYVRDRTDINVTEANTPNAGLPAPRLSKIILYDANNNLIKSFQFYQSYFVGYQPSVNANPIYDNRLRLDSLSITDNKSNNIEKYKFQYYTDSSIPTKKTFARDHWGYYNGADNNQTLIPSSLLPLLPADFKPSNFDWGVYNDRYINSLTNKVFTIKKIILPTGGEREFNFEDNRVNWYEYFSQMKDISNDGYDLFKQELMVRGSTLLDCFPTPDVVNQNNTQRTVYANEFTVQDYNEVVLGDPGLYIQTSYINPEITNTQLNGWAYSIEIGLQKKNGAVFSDYSILATVNRSNYVGTTLKGKLANLPDGIYRIYVKMTTPPDYVMNQWKDQSGRIKTYGHNTIVRLFYRKKNLTDIRVGGLRIKEILDRESTNQYKTTYDYTSAGNYSSGRLVSMPEYKEYIITTQTGTVPGTNPNAPDPCPGGAPYYGYRIWSESVFPITKTQGSNVGYTNVVKRQIGNSEEIKEEFVYNFKQSLQSGYLKEYYKETEPKPWQSGKLLSSKKYKNNGLVREDIFDYYGLENETDKGYVEEINTSLIKGNAYVFAGFCDDKWDIAIDRRHDNPVYGSGVNLLSPLYDFDYFAAVYNGVGTGNSNVSVFPPIKIPYFKIYSGFDGLKSKTTNDYSGSNITTQVENYYYDSLPSNLGLSRSEAISSTNDILRTKFYYPQDLPGEPLMQQMINANRIGLPVKTEKFKNTVKLFEEKFIYGQDLSTGNLLLPKFVYSANFPNGNPIITSPPVGQLEKQITYDKFDFQGNLLQYHEENKPPVSIIWSYNGQYPIAEIKNADYATIQTLLGAPALLSFSSKINPTDAEVKSFLAPLRTGLPNAQVITYTYTPLIGMTSQTDAKGQTTYYEYDEFQRLKNVKDQNGNIIKNNIYHYKP